MIQCLLPIEVKRWLSNFSSHHRLCTWTAEKDLVEVLNHPNWGTTLWAYDQAEWQREKGAERHTEETESPKAFRRSWEFECSLIASFETTPPSINSLIAHFPLWWHTGVISAEVEKVLILDVGPPRSIPNRTAHYWPDGVSYGVRGLQWNNGNRRLLRVG